MASSKPIFRDSAEKDLRKIDRAQIPRIIKAVRKFEQTPFPAGIRKLAGSENTYRLRVGDYRIIYFLDANGTVIIEHIRHRREAYRD